MAPRPAILFTAFEPSGDEHAAAVVAELKDRRPDRIIYAWGGREMAAAGAEVVERTGEDAVMGVPGLGKILEHRRINNRIGRWIKDHPEAVLHVPVDSPAANFPICRLAKRAKRRVVHLVAPQVWAWGTWRINKLRRLTDHVLCLLPFEEPWFRERDVPATFVGHPIFDEAPDDDALDAQARELPDGAAHLTLLPGSRPGEMDKNFPLLIEAFAQLRAQRPALVGVVAARDDDAAARLRSLADASPHPRDGLEIVAGRTEAAIRWGHAAIVVSGTVTLQVAQQRTPMVIVYKSNPLLYTLLAQWLLATEFFTLPNLIAGREIVPELVPHFGGAGPIAAHAGRLLDDPTLAGAQRDELDAVVSVFTGRRAAVAAADVIERFADDARA